MDPSMYGRRFFRGVPERHRYSWGDFSLAQKLSACLTLVAVAIAAWVWVPYYVPTDGGRIEYGWSWQAVEYETEDQHSRDLAAAMDTPEFRRQNQGFNFDATIHDLRWDQASQDEDRTRNTVLALLACGVLAHVVIQIVENWRFEAAQDRTSPSRG